MDIRRSASAGTMESSDIMVIVSPGEGEVKVDLTSTVAVQYGAQIERLIREVAGEAGIQDANIRAMDFGALDCTIRARVTTALERAVKEEGK